MSLKEKYPGYPRYVVLGMWKCGTKTMHEVFASLGCKVFDAHHMMDYADQLNMFGREEIEFAELAKVWEDNEFDAIIEPAGIYWTFMAEHWPKTKFIHLTRDEESWKKSFSASVRACYDPKGSVEHLIANNSFISPSMNAAVECMDGYAKNMAGGAAYQLDSTKSDKLYTWPRFIPRIKRLFDADVLVNAPKERTLFNYSVKDGWPRLREFLGIPNTDGDEFPHANQRSNADTFIENLFAESEYRKRYIKDLTDYLNNYGLTVTEIKN